MMWNLIFYTTERGKCPVETFLDDLPTPLRAAAVKDLSLLEQYGNELTMPYSKAMGNGVFELRIHQGNNAARVFYFFQIGNDIVLTNGFIKKTQKTPQKELEKALKYKANYEQRIKK